MEPGNPHHFHPALGFTPFLGGQRWEHPVFMGLGVSGLREMCLMCLHTLIKFSLGKAHRAGVEV